MELSVNNKKRGNKAGAGCLTVFGGIFLQSGGIFLVGLASIYSSLQANDWQPVEATITRVEQVISRGDDSTTYGVNGAFQYQYEGQTYISSSLTSTLALIILAVINRTFITA